MQVPALFRAVVVFAATLAAAIGGATLAYYPAEHIACVVRWPQSNLCGVVSVFFAMPLGFIAGGIVGWLIARFIVSRIAT